MHSLKMHKKTGGLLRRPAWLECCFQSQRLCGPLRRCRSRLVVEAPPTSGCRPDVDVSSTQLLQHPLNQCGLAAARLQQAQVPC